MRAAYANINAMTHIRRPNFEYARADYYRPGNCFIVFCLLIIVRMT